MSKIILISFTLLTLFIFSGSTLSCTPNWEWLSLQNGDSYAYDGESVKIIDKGDSTAISVIDLWCDGGIVDFEYNLDTSNTKPYDTINNVQRPYGVTTEFKIDDQYHNIIGNNSSHKLVALSSGTFFESDYSTTLDTKGINKNTAYGIGYGPNIKVFGIMKTINCNLESYCSESINYNTLKNINGYKTRYKAFIYGLKPVTGGIYSKKRGRTLISHANENRYVVIYTANSKSMTTAMNEMSKYGVSQTDIVMLDGNGTSQLYTDEFIIKNSGNWLCGDNSYLFCDKRKMSTSISIWDSK